MTRFHGVGSSSGSVEPRPELLRRVPAPRERLHEPHAPRRRSRARSRRRRRRAPISSTTTAATSHGVSEFDSAAVMLWSRSERRRSSCSASKSRLRSSAWAHWETTVWSQLPLALGELLRRPEREVQRAADAGGWCAAGSPPSPWSSALLLERERRPCPRRSAPTRPRRSRSRARTARRRRARSAPRPRSRRRRSPVLVTTSTVTPSGRESTTKPASAPTALSACSRQVLLTSVAVEARESAAVISWSRRVSSARQRGLRLRAAALHLLEREPGLVGEAAEERRSSSRIGLRQDARSTRR